MKILFCTDVFPNAVEILRRYVAQDEVVTCAPAEIPVQSRDADVLVPGMSRIGADIIDRTAARMVHQFGVGLEGVDIPAATSKGIYVANVPSNEAGGNAISVAEHAIFLMLALARKYPAASRNLVQGTTWGAPIGAQLRGKTVTIVGLGNIGAALVERLKAFGMRVLGTRRNPDLPVRNIDYLGGPDDLPRLLGESDFVVMAVPVTDETRGMIGHAELAVIKKGAFIVNVARGPLIDYDALVQALENGQLAGAGLDVFWHEPVDPTDPLFQLNVIATPHVAGVTDTSYDEIVRDMAANVDRLRQGLHPVNCVNLEELQAASQESQGGR
jgi:phosphoglycerate dehydrogenase-like enzyme